MRLALCITFLVTLMMGRVDAQTISIDNGPPNVFAMRAPVKVTESFSIPVSIDANTSFDAYEQTVDSARRRLYDLVKRECTPLSDSFASECRIVSLHINLVRNIVPMNSTVTSSGPNLRSVDANVTYELMVKG